MVTPGNYIPNLNTADLSRFNFYAPYVSHLHILPNLYAKYRFSDWEKLRRYARSTTLLPNLQTLVYVRDSSKDEKFVRWIIPLLPPNILTVHTHSVEWSCEANISMGRASILLKAISKRCADITDLSFFPVEPYFHTDDDETGLEIDTDSDPAGNVVPGGAIKGDTSRDEEDPNDEFGSGQLGSGPPPFWEYFKHTRSLQNLTTTSFIIHSETLGILASLPNLKKIVLYCAYPNEYIVYQLSPEYPEHPFPSLDTLNLVLPDMECVSQIWNVGPLVNRLTDVSVVLRAGSEDAWGMDDDDDDEFAYTRSFIAFIPELCKRSPRIQKLTVDFDATEGEMIQAVSLETLKSLVTLPLQKLDLRHASLAPVTQACSVLKGCHTLRDLHIQDQRISYDELLRFAQIPGLECLHAEIHWKDVKGLRRSLNNSPQRSSDIRLVLCSLPLHVENDNAMLKDITSSNRVLSTPELVDLLASHAKKSDLACLARTSRSCFNTTIPLVWREVQGIHHLLVLIPGTQFERGNQRKEWKLTLPDVHTADLTRFNFYAPYVYRLNILPEPYSIYQFFNWETLSSYATSTRLLPNLRTIEFEYLKSDNQEFLDLILPFLSTNLFSLYTHSVDHTSEAMLSMYSARTLLDAISERCTDLTELSFFPVDPFISAYEVDRVYLRIHHDVPGRDVVDKVDEELSDEDPGISPRHIDVSSEPLNTPVERSPTPSVYSHHSPSSEDPYINPSNRPIAPFPRSDSYYYPLKHARSLRTLTTTSFMLSDGALEILGELPNLEKLDLYCGQLNGELEYYDSSGLSEHAFPSLRTLRLLLPDMDCIKYVWGTSPLVKHLTEVTIQLQGDTDDPHALDPSDSLMSFLPAICTHSPNIQEFTVDFDATEGDPIWSVPIETLASLAALPLRKLDLRHALLEDLVNACQVLNQCHTLRDLHFQDQRISYDALISFAQISKLECLHTDMDWADVQRLQTFMNIVIGQQPRNNLMFLKCSRPSFVEPDITPLLDITCFLYILFPRLEEVSLVGTSMYGVGPGTTDKIYAVIGRAIKNLRLRLGASLLGDRRLEG
ncbi:hypothetical protein FRC08_000861 [Ceratobasidium sp. 394]|nr:hypothetical protein FRC08_000861 [Ceratobasidium sp. 394]